jgi:transketolase N-terminal domain/subunit
MTVAGVTQRHEGFKAVQYQVRVGCVGHCISLAVGIAISNRHHKKVKLPAYGVKSCSP